MLFNSIEFALFLPIVFVMFWMIPASFHTARNLLIVAASYFFYGWWDARFLLLLAASTAVDYTMGLAMARYQATGRKLALWISLFVNLGTLAFFKYYNFFVDSFAEAFTLLGHTPNLHTLQIILPVGISFYTFQTLSYTIDVYRREIEPCRNFPAFCAYVSFFPQLVAGPIERAGRLLPQFYRPRHFDAEKATEGLRQMLWGLFKKIIIADNCSPFVEQFFSAPGLYNGSTLLLGAVLFAFQIYCDFSGYSDIAIGTAKLFGFDLMRNFAYPYFSRNIAEFWRRWHISLSSWFRDYVYIPLGGNTGSISRQTKNVFIVFLLSGLWHGANWTFVFWGLAHALLFLPLLLGKRNRTYLDTVAHGKMLPSARELLLMLLTFVLVVLAWIFFRAESLTAAFHYLRGIFNPSLLSFPSFEGKRTAALLAALITVLVMAEWRSRQYAHPLEAIEKRCSRPVRWALYYSIVVVIFLLGGKEQEFIYFQF